MAASVVDSDERELDGDDLVDSLVVAGECSVDRSTIAECRIHCSKQASARVARCQQQQQQASSAARSYRSRSAGDARKREPLVRWRRASSRRQHSFANDKYERGVARAGRALLVCACVAEQCCCVCGGRVGVVVVSRACAASGNRLRIAAKTRWFNARHQPLTKVRDDFQLTARTRTRTHAPHTYTHDATTRLKENGAV